MAHIDVPLSRSGFGQTRRVDNWWVQPVVVFFVLSAFIVYSTWAALQGQHYRFGPYLSPFYSPELFGLLTAGLAECRTGCRSGSLRRCSSFGRRGDFESPAITTAGPITKLFGPIHLPVR